MEDQISHGARRTSMNEWPSSGCLSPKWEEGIHAREQVWGVRI